MEILEILGKQKEGRNRREGGKRGEKREQTLEKPTSFGEKEGDLAFQRALTLKSSLRVKLGA